MTAAAAAMLIAAAVWLGQPTDVRRRIRRLAPTSDPSRGRRPTAISPVRLASWVAAAAALLLIGGVVGVAAAVACVVVLPRLLGRFEGRAARERRARLAAQAPLVADLLAATLAAGSPVRPALAVVSTAMGDPAREVMRPVLAALDLGSDVATAWAPLAVDPSLGSIAQAVIRSAESGAPLSAVLSRIAEDLRREHQTVVEVAARSAGVRAVLPLAACFLPAFLLLGVVPVVAALAGGLMGS